MGIEATGRLHAIFDTKQVSERFSKREFVVEISDNPKYPQLVLFQLTGDRCAQLDQLRVGDDVRIDFSLRGREWRSPQGETKYFNSLDAWTVEAGGARASNQRGRGNDSRQDPRGGGGGPRGGGNARGGGRGAPPDFDAPARSDDDMRPGDAYGSSRSDEEDIPF